MNRRKMAEDDAFRRDFLEHAVVRSADDVAGVLERLPAKAASFRYEAVEPPLPP